jgi:hypothetical protein
LSSGEVWAAGQEGQIFWYRPDAGWQLETVLDAGTSDVVAIDGRAIDDHWAVGNVKALAHRSAAGWALHPRLEFRHDTLSDVWVSPAGSVWISAFQAGLYRGGDGGMFEELPVASTEDLNQKLRLRVVLGFGEHELWLAGGYESSGTGVIRRYRVRRRRAVSGRTDFGRPFSGAGFRGHLRNEPSFGATP